VTAPYVIGCDVGSQGTKAALYGADGSLVASAYEGYDVSYPHPGWAEQDPQAWLDALATTIRQVVEAVPERPDAIAAISFGSQLDGMVVCDRRGQPLRPAMIWMDRRAEQQAAWMSERIPPEEFYRLVGANLDSSHAVFKALWVRDQEPDVFGAAAHLMPPGSFVAWHATGVLAVDHSNASSLALLDPRTRTWSEPVLEAANVTEDLLPELTRSTAVLGPVTSSFAARAGLSERTQVVMGCGDEMAATLGAGVFEPGEVCDVVGTAEPVCAASSEPRADPTMLVECHPHADPDAWLLENPGFVSGGGLRWWRDQFAPLERRAELDGQGDAYDMLCAEAEKAPPGADGVVFLPSLQGAMAPEWNGSARAAFSGLSLAHTRAHMTRAMLEGSAFALRDIVEAMRGAGLDVRRITMVGGGAKGSLWRQIKADVTGLPVRVPETVETTSTGAAILAAVGSGVHATIADAVAAFVRFRPGENEPDPATTEVYEGAYRRYRDTYFALKPVFASG